MKLCFKSIIVTLALFALLATSPVTTETLVINKPKKHVNQKIISIEDDSVTDCKTMQALLNQGYTVDKIINFGQSRHAYVVLVKY
jgi:hypothetical protein